MLTFSAVSFEFGKEALHAIARILVLLLALCVHEWAHAFAAVKCGDPTPKVYGRLTLNPLRHFEPLGFIMMLLVNVGFAKPVPINPNNYRHPRRDNVFVSLAGITANFIMAFIFVMIFTCVGTFAPGFALNGVFAGELGAYFVMDLLQAGVTINVCLMVFNLLPIYPLDGFKFVETFTRWDNRYRRFMLRYGQYVLLGLLLESVVMNAIYRATGITAFYYMDILGNLISYVSDWVIWPIEKLWSLFWGVFV